MKPITTHPFTPDLLTSPKYFWNCKTKEELAAYYAELKQRQLVNPTDGDDKALLAITQENKKVFRLISSTVETMNGWATVRKGCSLAALVLATKPKVVLEVGVYAGRSLLPMAMAMRELGNGGKVIGIDPYSSSESSLNEWGPNEKWWRELDHAAIHDEFMNYVKRFQLQDVVQLIKRPAAHVKEFETDITHLDGNHQDGVILEAQRFGGLMRVGGLMVLDDRHWAGGAILRAEDELEDMGFKKAFDVSGEGDDWGVMQKVQ